MKVCIIDPKGIHFGINTGIGYLAGYLREHSAVDEIKVFDFNNNTSDIEKRIKEISSYDVVGFSIKSFTLDNAMKVAREIRREGSVMIAGGPHITLDGVEFMEQHPEFDYAVMGEGELTFNLLLDAIKNKKPVDGIKGIIFRDDYGKCISNGKGDRVEDLDTIPYPAYDTFDSVQGKGIYNYPLVTSRGCPYLCTYCCVKGVIGKKWYARKVEYIIDELAMAKKKYNVDCFNVQDDVFTLDMERAKEFCDGLMKEEVELKWSCPNGIRADKVDDELMGKMHSSGCFGVAMGIESGVEAEFDAIKKGEKLDDIISAVHLAKKHNVWVFGNFIVGLPGATLASTRESIRFAKGLGLESCIFNMIVPFPNTEVWEWVKKNGTIIMDWKDGFTQGKSPKVVFDTLEFKAEDRIRAYWESNIKCKNYFCCMDEHDSLFSNIIRVLYSIVRYDFFGLPSHLLWMAKHSGRILGRILKKT
ncbi:MAG: cobalamin-dependent protein [Deltaproteobacteria bacterium]|nr:cobalamin-dependent protein [Deltaproteobacteria bacterium]